ncbi:MAG: hypothetical protein AAB539_02490 [Patescibacteria group bacterium]
MNHKFPHFTIFIAGITVLIVAVIIFGVTDIPRSAAQTGGVQVRGNNLTVPGSLGIGIITPGAKLHVVTPNNTDLDQPRFLSGGAAGTWNEIILGSTFGAPWYNSAILRYFNGASIPANSRLAIFNAGDPDILGINIIGGGNIGINTATPGGMGDGGTPRILQVHGGAGYGLEILSSSATANNSYMGIISFGSTALTGAEKRTGLISSTKRSGSATSPTGDLQFWTANGGTPTAKMTIDAAGNIGINKTSPSGRLHIKANSDAWTTGLRLEDDVTTNFYDVIFDNQFRIGYNSATKLTLNSAGDAAITGNLTVAGQSVCRADGTNCPPPPGGAGLWATNGTDGINSTNTGNVGIGTVSPTQKLTVNGNIALVAVNPTLDFAVPDNGRINWTLGNSLHFVEGNTQLRMVIATGGNVGINTVTPGAGSPDALTKLDVVNGTVRLDRYLIINPFPGYGTGYARMWFDGDGGLGTGAGLSRLQLGVGATDQLTLTNAGNVGIGTGNPYNPQGWNKVLDLHGGPHAKMIATNDNGVRVGIYSHDAWDGAAGSVGTESNHPLRFLTNYTERMRLDTSGFVRIPAHPFFLAGHSGGWETCATGWNLAPYDTVLGGNTGGWYSTASNLFTAPVTGLYMCTSHHYNHTNGVMPGYIHHQFSCNGDLVCSGEGGVAGTYGITEYPPTGEFQSSTATRVLYLPAGMTVGVSVYCSNGGTYRYGGYSQFSCALQTPL